MDGGVAAFDDLGGKAVQGVRVESMVQGRHLVQDAAKGPNVGLVVVGLVLKDLRRVIPTSKASENIIFLFFTRHMSSPLVTYSKASQCKS